MKLCDLVNEGAVVVPLASSERDEAIAELLDKLIESGGLDASLREPVLGAILEREARGSTGFGKGVAVPHVKHSEIPSMQAALGVSQGGVEFMALDKQPVYSVFLLLSPADKPEEHLQAMEVIFKNLSQERFRRFLRQADSPGEAMQVLKDADDQLLGG